jgi:hypothetical protein
LQGGWILGLRGNFKSSQKEANVIARRVGGRDPARRNNPSAFLYNQILWEIASPVGLDTAKNGPTQPTGLAMTDVVGIFEISCYELRIYFRS